MEITSSGWILNILSYAKFNDLRLVRRFGLILESLVQRPAASIPEANASWALTIRLIAIMGGFLGRKSDGQPGIMAIWKGLRRLDDITETYCIFAKMGRQK